MYVCVIIHILFHYIYICTHSHTYLYTIIYYIYTLTYKCTYSFISIYTHMIVYIMIYMYTYMWDVSYIHKVYYTHTHTHTHTYIYIYIYIYKSMDALPANRTWQPSCSHGTYQHKAITSRSRQLLLMGTRLPETCWATIRREIKNTKSDI